MPDGSLIRAARVFVTNRRVIVHTAKPTRAISTTELAITDASVIVPGKGTLGPSESIELCTSDGTAWLTKDAGCGCGSVLRALSPPMGYSG